MVKGPPTGGSTSNELPVNDEATSSAAAPERAPAVRKKKKRRKRVRAMHTGEGIEVVCRDCNAVVRAEDIDLPSRLAKCASCHHVFSFTVGGDDGAESSDVARFETVPRPAKFHVADDPVTSNADGYRVSAHSAAKRLRIEWRWFSPIVVPLLAFCVFWDGFLVFWYLKAPPSLAVMAFPLLHVGVGVGLTYYALAKIVNRTTLVVDGANLRVQHAPLPWPQPGAIPIQDIDQVYCRRERQRGRSHYSVHAIVKSGKTQKLVGGLEEPEEALFLEHALERALEIADYPVAGEFRG